MLIVPLCSVIMAYGEYTAVYCIQFNGNMQVHTPKIAPLVRTAVKKKTRDEVKDHHAAFHISTTEKSEILGVKK